MKLIKQGDTEQEVWERLNRHPIDVVGKGLRCFTCKSTYEVTSEDTEGPFPEVRPERYFSRSRVQYCTSVHWVCPNCKRDQYSFFYDR
jgi:hypothetical protein